MRFLIPVLAAILVPVMAVQAAADEEHNPKLLLNAQRLRRLKRDRERQTQRWISFEQRVKTAPDSPERGFELALYFAVTGDAGSRTDALAWASAHPCEIRQVSLIADWVGLPIPAGTSQCPTGEESELERIRDACFLKIAAGGKPSPSADFIPAVTNIGLDNGGALYAAVEYVDAFRSATHEDLRRQAVNYFADLPSLFLLSLSPERLSKPGWRMHSAALALVSIDPNLEGSQFLQSWAMEQSQTISDGPGVAYELLWADPYLPGVSYLNMEPALYQEPESTLTARTSWDDVACRIKIQPGSVRAENCSPDWQGKRMEFGHLTLVPIQERCVDLSTRPANQVTIIWKLNPEAKLVYSEDRKQQTRSADHAGMWRVSAEFHGKVCAIR